MPEKILDIYVNQDHAGRLWLENELFCFQYTEEWRKSKTFGVSLSLPIRKETYSDDYAKPFFTNLLPEGEVRKVIEQRLRIEPGKDFDLLSRIGGECAGAIIVMPEGQKPSEDYSYKMLPEEEIGKLIDRMRITPFFADDEKVRLSLAGAQDKAPVFYDGQRVGIPEGNTPSTHILKPQSLRFKNLVENETFIMNLAKRVGLNVPNVDILQYEDQSAFIIERYDRINVGNKIHRLMQEDFCQIMRLSADDKYDAHKGSTFANCHQIIEDNCVNSIDARTQFLKWISFNALTGNEDAHSKNISLLYKDSGIELAPFYDLVNTYTYDGLQRNCAMAIGNESHILAFMPTHFDQLAIQFGIRKDVIHDINKDMLEKLNHETNYLRNEFTDKYGPSRKVDEIVKMISRAVAKLDNSYTVFQTKTQKIKRA